MAVLLLLSAVLAAAVAHDHHLSNTNFDHDRELLILSDRNFEHATQAATGQTSGTWLVLFTETNNEDGKAAEIALQRLLGDTDWGIPLLAKVDLGESPRTAKRFAITNPPVLKLFRNRRMFTYSGGWSAPTIYQFANEGWRRVVAEEVPRDIGPLDDLWQGLTASLHLLGRYIGALALASLVALAGYTLTR